MILVMTKKISLTLQVQLQETLSGKAIRNVVGTGWFTLALIADTKMGVVPM